MTAASPFVKWVGGKRRLVPELLKHAPKKFGKYFEPFVGGGAMFFALAGVKGFGGDHAVLSDANRNLINAYRSVKFYPNETIQYLKGFKYDSEEYYRVRAQFNQWPLRSKPTESVDVIDSCQAARFIYLNRTGFNGLYRTNASGDFNVPFGRYTNPTICDEEGLLNCSKALQSATILWGGFELAAEAIEGDFAYFDPPYLPITATSFTKYNKEEFGYTEHLALAHFAAELKARGVHVLVSNSSSVLIRELYSGLKFNIQTVSAARSVNSNGAGRGKVDEIVAF